jgi:bifunctional non-homologous end joining protein LigD
VELGRRERALHGRPEAGPAAPGDRPARHRTVISGVWGRRPLSAARIALASLDEYHRKRDFKKTPEPRGEAPRDTGGFSFCIQKHAATRLHYDFRLELDGVLLSWAVPKGPAYDMAEKRLAMRTEDHPLEYGGFEGIIPAGQYGGGTVLLWDRGTWEPIEDPHAGLAKGALKFRLKGEKLQGAWALIKIKGRDAREAEKTWLLIKERDDAVRPLAKYDVTVARPESVATGRSLEEVARDRDRVWESNREEAPRPGKWKPKVPGPKAPAKPEATPAPAKAAAVPGARKAALPRFVEPQLATLVKEAPEGGEWLHELKFDGYRIQARKDGDAVTLWSRNEKDWTAHLPQLVEAVARLPCREALIDGEAAALLPDGTTSFNAFQNAMEEGGARLVYFAFDLLHCDGQDLTGATLEDRKAALAALLERAGPAADPIRFSDHVEGAGGAFFEQACRMKLEGIISKRRRDAYRPGRGQGWVKTKCMREQEMVIAGFTDPEGGRQGVGALLLAVNQDGSLVYSGKVGTGFTVQSARDLRKKLDALEVDTVPFAKRPPGLKGAHWVKPTLVAQVQFTEWTPDGHLRHPSFKGLRADKAAAEVVREEPAAPRAEADGERAPAPRKKAAVKAAPKAAPKSTPAARAKELDRVGGVRMTHPERVLFPALGLTKRALAEFYVAIADWILPHLAGRPTSLVRCPEGVGKPCFYQKHGAATAPPELRRVRIQEKKKTGDYLVVDDTAGLVALTQMSILEIHTWNSHADTLEEPDRVVFDLDPAEGLPWKRVVAGALLLRAELKELGLRSFVKTTGGKGLHVVAPIARGPGWDEAYEFSRRLAEKIAGERPREYLAEMSKAQRVGRIYIDYVRNQRGATSVCAYSTRAKSDAPVSVPLEWDELEEAKPPAFTVATVSARLQKLRADPWKAYDGLKQKLPSALD